MEPIKIEKSQLDQKTFEAGMTLLVRMFPSDFVSPAGLTRRNLYFSLLMPIPPDMFLNGVERCLTEWKPYKTDFPTVAEIGEFCVPGERFINKRIDNTNRWEKVDRPWTERLRRLRAKERREREQAIQPRLSLEEKAGNDDRRRQLGVQGLELLKNLVRKWDTNEPKLKPEIEDQAEEEEPFLELSEDQLAARVARKEHLRLQREAIRRVSNG